MTKHIIIFLLLFLVPNILLAQWEINIDEDTFIYTQEDCGIFIPDQLGIKKSHGEFYIILSSFDGNKFQGDEVTCVFWVGDESKDSVDLKFDVSPSGLTATINNSNKCQILIDYLSSKDCVEIIASRESGNNYYLKIPQNEELKKLLVDRTIMGNY